MRKKPLSVLLSAACVGACVLLISCATEKPFSTEGLTAEEVFQRAQDAADRDNNTMAIAYYSAVPEKFPDDKAHGIWSTYEIAFLYHKMGKNEKALSMINQILDRYTKEGDTLPPAPQILAQKLKAKLEASVVTATPPKKP